MTKTVEIRWNWWCKIFSLKIRRCKVLDKFHVCHKYSFCFGFANIVYPNYLFINLFIYPNYSAPIIVILPICLTLHFVNTCSCYLDFLLGWNMQCLDLYCRFQLLILSLDGQIRQKYPPKLQMSINDKTGQPPMFLLCRHALCTPHNSNGLKLNFLAPPFLFQEERIGNVNVKCTF